MHRFVCGILQVSFFMEKYKLFKVYIVKKEVEMVPKIDLQGIKEFVDEGVGTVHGYNFVKI